MDANHNIESAFAWNEVDFNNREFTSLGMVLMEGEARIHEIVCVDSNGNRVFPSNADNYPNLFDEQGLFPGIRTYYDRACLMKYITHVPRMNFCISFRFMRIHIRHLEKQ